MSKSVNLYGTAYGNYAAQALAEVRRETYGEDFGQSSWVTAADYRRFFRILELSSANHVLDVGSGSGGPALFLAREVGCRVTGIDVNEAGISNGQLLARDARMSDRVSFERADVSEPLPFPDATFDAVVCIDVLCHLPDRGRIFQEWYRVLRPRGRMLVTDPVVVTGLVTKDEFATRSSTGHFEFCSTGINERLITDAKFQLELTEDATVNEADVSRRWHDGRENRKAELVELEGEETFAGLQRFLATVHLLTSERRLSRYIYVGRKMAN